MHLLIIKVKITCFPCKTGGDTKSVLCVNSQSVSGCVQDGAAEDQQAFSWLPSLREADALG